MFSIRSRSRLVTSARRRVRPRVDLLEGRELLSTLTVTSPADSGPGTFRDQVAAAASGDTINFAPSLNGQTITLTTGPVFDTGKSLNIVGPGASKLTISGNDSSAILVLQQDSTSIDVSISGLTLAHGNSPYSGGAIYTYGTNLTLSNDVLRDNHSAGGGGAIEAQAPFSPTGAANTMTITDTQFLSNSSDFVGGASESFGVTVNLTRVTATNNSITGQGFGGGFVASGASMSVTSSAFTNNTGGAISHFPGYGPTVNRLDVTGSTFLGNTRASGLGGAISNGGGVATYTNCLFQDNVTTDPFFAQGGAIYNSGDVTIDGSTFSGNRADGTGAGTTGFGVAVGGAAFLDSPTQLDIRNSTFRDNLSTGTSANGGAISVSTFAFSFTPPQLHFSGLSFEHNRSIGVVIGTSSGYAQAGALAINSVPGNITIADTTFRENEALGGDGSPNFGGAAQGGALVTSGGFPAGGPNTIDLTNVAFLGNRALGGSSATGGGIGAGGAIMGFSSQTATITGGVFNGNSATGGTGGNGNTLAAGGAIVTFGPSLTVNGTAFVNNLAQGGDGSPGQAGSRAIGGAIEGGNLTLNNATFVHNTAAGGRGGAAVGATGTGGRGGDATGGAIDTGNATVNGGTFVQNSALGGRGGSAGSTGTGGAGGDGKGGAIAIDVGTFGGVLNVNDATFVQNQAIGGDGGSGGTPGVVGQGLGGAIYNNGGTVVIKRTKFVKNRASTAGNDVYGPYTS